MTRLIARPWLLLALSLLLFGIALVAALLLINGAPGPAVADYSPARPAFVLAAVAIAGIGLSIVGLVRRRE